jgi:hypothetical protein
MWPCHGAAGQGKIVGALLVRQSKISAGAAPLGAVGLDAPATRAVMGEQVREFMSQRARDFFFSKFSQPGI